MQYFAVISLKFPMYQLHCIASLQNRISSCALLTTDSLDRLGLFMRFLTGSAHKISSAACDCCCCRCMFNEQVSKNISIECFNAKDSVAQSLAEFLYINCSVYIPATCRYLETD